MCLRVFNYNTLEKVHQFEAHTDYIRSLAVHPTQPYVLSCSDDMMIKMWDWDKKWQCVQVRWEWYWREDVKGRYIESICCLSSHFPTHITDL